MSEEQKNKNEGTRDAKASGKAEGKADGKKGAKSEGKPTGKKGKAVKKKRAKKRTLLTAHVYINAGYNNTNVTVTEPNGEVVCWSTSGASGFRGSRKATPYAAQVAMENAITKAKNLGLERVHVFVKGVGVGRDQAMRAIPQADIEIESITDLTALSHGGVRPRRPRRV